MFLYARGNIKFFYPKKVNKLWNWVRSAINISFDTGADSIFEKLKKNGLFHNKIIPLWCMSKLFFFSSSAVRTCMRTRIDAYSNKMIIGSVNALYNKNYYETTTTLFFFVLLKISFVIDISWMCKKQRNEMTWKEVDKIVVFFSLFRRRVAITKLKTREKKHIDKPDDGSAYDTIRVGGQKNRKTYS